jgi:hypothetical protein
MIYQNALIGTLNFNGTQIVDFIQDWVSTGPLIKVDGDSDLYELIAAAPLLSHP